MLTVLIKVSGVMLLWWKMTFGGRQPAVEDYFG